MKSICINTRCIRCLIKNKRRKEYYSFYRLNRDVYKVFNSSSDKEVFIEKYRFLETFSLFVHRKYYNLFELKDDQLETIIYNGKYIFKPMDKYGGRGIYVVSNGEQLKGCKGLLEECISRYDNTLKAFHPESLNTIRVLTISNGGKCVFVGAIFRCGRNGSIVDNASAGGLFANINLENGIINSDGYDKYGAQFVCHPDTNLQFKGTSILGWQNFKIVVEQLTRVVPNVHIVGWDICVLEDGSIEVIEGNIAPDIDMMQMAAQHGLKPNIENGLAKVSLK